MDYNSLVAPKGTKGSIANWLNYTDAILPLPDILTDAQAMLIVGGVPGIAPLRVMAMQEATPVFLAAPAVSVALPGDFLSPVCLMNAVGVPVPLKDIASLLRRRPLDATGNPQQATYPSAYAVSGDSMQFDFTVTAGTTLNLTYYGAPVALSVAAPTNILTTKYPHLLRAACLTVAADYMNDDGKYQRYMQRLAETLAGVNSADDLSYLGMEVDRGDYGL